MINILKAIFKINFNIFVLLYLFFQVHAKIEGMKNAVKQNWQKATKKRILFKLGQTLVGDIDLIQESNNNNSIQEDNNMVPMLDEQDRELRKLADHAASVKFDDEDDWKTKRPNFGQASISPKQEKMNAF